MKNIKSFFVICIFFINLSIVSIAQTNYKNEVQKWREKTETELKSENSWLSLAGLFWLKEGINTIGSSSANDIKLPNVTAEKVGNIEYKNGVAKLSVNQDVKVVSDGKSVTNLELISDEKGKPTLIELGDVSFTLIKRENRFGIRVRDKNNINRREFKGLNWFPINESYRIEADFEAYSEPKEIDIPNVLGGVYKLKSAGLIKFKLKGKQFSFEPVAGEDNKFFIIFNDLTSRKTTYQSGRFLYADKPVNGKVILDFNEAYNPPCAFTEFATCPLPPPQNRLKIEIKAGEKRYESN
jgi:uncharacterized protein